MREQQEHQIWGAYAQRLLDPGSGLWRNPSGGGHDDKAHPPIHPTKFSAGERGWSQDHHVKVLLYLSFKLHICIYFGPCILSSCSLLSSIIVRFFLHRNYMS